MAGKFMKVKKIIIPIMTLVILTSQLAGCSSLTSNEMLDMLQNGQDIEISIAMPNYSTDGIGVVQAVVNDRIQLDRLNTYEDFRQAFEDVFNIRPLELTNSTSKLGCIYVNKSGIHEGNNVLMDSLRNKVFMENYFAKNQDDIGEAAILAYTDLEGDDYESVMGALNAYYNLLNDSEDGEDIYFNAMQSVNRGEFYSLVYRATNPVNHLLKVEGDFVNKVGVQDKDSLYASQVDQFAWLNADNGGLRSGNYKSSISRGEAVYMLMNMYFGDELSGFDISTANLSDATNGGSFIEDTDKDRKVSNALYDEKNGSADDLVNGWQLGALSKMLDSGSVQEDIYCALGLAEQLGVIESETRWDEPLSKTEAIDLMVKVGSALNERDGYLCEVEDGDYSMFITHVEVTEDDVIENVEVTTIDDVEVETGTINGDAYATLPDGTYEQSVKQAEEERKAEEQAQSNPSTSQPSNNTGNSGNSGVTPGSWLDRQGGDDGTGGFSGDDGANNYNQDFDVVINPEDENIKWE